MDSAEAQHRIQAAYPRIYLACHSQHQNARTTPQKLSQRDATLLAHLHPTQETSQSDLARHIGVAKSTLSEALAVLEETGYVLRRNGETDSRGVQILRTPAGILAMSAGSVLDSARLPAASGTPHRRTEASRRGRTGDTRLCH